MYSLSFLLSWQVRYPKIFFLACTCCWWHGLIQQFVVSASQQFSFFFYFLEALHCIVLFALSIVKYHCNYIYALLIYSCCWEGVIQFDVVSLSNSPAAFKSALTTSSSFIRASSHFWKGLSGFRYLFSFLYFLASFFPSSCFSFSSLALYAS